MSHNNVLCSNPQCRKPLELNRAIHADVILKGLGASKPYFSKGWTYCSKECLEIVLRVRKGIPVTIVSEVQRDPSHFVIYCQQIAQVELVK